MLKSFPVHMNRRQFIRNTAIGAMTLSIPKVVWSRGRKILKVRDYAAIVSFDPVKNYALTEELVYHAIYNKLISYVPGDKWAWRLEAAESIEQVDATHIKFVLKKGIKFTHNYGEMTADDVKFSLERHLDPSLKSSAQGDLGTFSHVQKTGKYAGVIVLKEPFQPIWMAGLAWVAGNIISKKATLEKGGTFSAPPCSSGPYKLKFWKPKQVAILERNDQWIGKPADFDEIHIRVIDDEKYAEIGYEAGDLDFTRISMSSIGHFISTPQPNSTLITKSSNYYVWLGMNMENSILKNRRVRKAIQYAVDVDAILEAAYFGVAKRATGIIAPGLIGHRPSNRIKEPDIAKAKTLLAEAGYADGLELSLEILNKTTFATAAQVIQASLSQIGIRLVINAHDSGTFWSLGDESKGDDWKKIELILNRYANGPEPYTATQWFTTGQVGVWNWERFNHPEYDRLHRAAAVETDNIKRDKMYQRMLDFMEEEGAYIFITHEVNPLIYRNTIQPALRPDGVPMWRYFKSVS